MITYGRTRDVQRTCPDCNQIGALSFVEIKGSRRTHIDADGAECVVHFGPTRDYQCRNCDCEFTMTEWEGA